MTHSEDIYYIRCTKGLEQHRGLIITYTLQRQLKNG